MTLFGWIFFAALAAIICVCLYLTLRNNKSNPEG